MSRFTATARWSALILVLLAAPAATASAQCLVTGPEVMCGAPVELCGPTGPYAYEWTLPDGSRLATACVSAAQAGTYSLRVFDRENRMWFGPCQHTVTAAAAGVLACAIDGVTEGCAGDTLTLCGPSGLASYAWSGPDGFIDSAACVRVTLAGTYTLTVRDASGCNQGTCQAVVTFRTCGTSLACPKPPTYFARACDPADPAVSRLDAAQIAALATCVDDRAAAFAWSDPASGFCSTMEGDDGLRASARRQVAAVWANACATELGVVPRRGRPLSLDPSTPVHIPYLYTGTVGDWLAAADARLVELDGKRQRDPRVRLAYLALTTVGWCIDHGVGIGPTCASPRGWGFEASVPADLTVDGETLASALVESTAPALMMGRPSPNPSPGAVTLEYAVEGVSASPVHIAVVDVSGRTIRTLVDGPVEPGLHVARWDGRDRDGAPVRGGMYFVVGRLGDQRVETRVTMLQ